MTESGIGVAVDLHVVDVRVGERLDLGGHLVGRGLLVGRQGRVREEQVALELAEEQRLGEPDVRRRRCSSSTCFFCSAICCGGQGHVREPPSARPGERVVGPARVYSIGIPRRPPSRKRDSDRASEARLES